MPETFEDRQWELLLERINDGECTPFLGAGACYGVLPLGSEIAREWSEGYHYPMTDSCGDLPRVAQFLAVEYDSMFPKGKIVKKFEGVEPPDFDEPDEPHGILADLPLPIYITTNYDDFMFRALRSRNREAEREFCRWNEKLKSFNKRLDFEPGPEKPLVFHLHGIFEEPQSIVLTEDDYLEFIMNISKYRKLIPARIEDAFTDTSLLFLGYSLGDWNFRVLFRSIVSYLPLNQRMSHVSVQLVPGGNRISEVNNAREYLSRYFGKKEIHVYWGTCRQFAAELKRRWGIFRNGR